MAFSTSLGISETLIVIFMLSVCRHSFSDNSKSSFMSKKKARKFGVMSSEFEVRNAEWFKSA